MTLTKEVDALEEVFKDVTCQGWHPVPDGINAFENENVMILETGFNLFRYFPGHIKLPNKWDKSFKNAEYLSTLYGPKNKIGAFYFYNTEDTAIAVGNKALEKNSELGNYAITTCKTIESILLLDLTSYHGKTISLTDDHPTIILNILKENGIDVFNGEYNRYDNDMITPFSSIANAYELISPDRVIDNSLQSLSRLSSAISTVDSFFYDCIPYIGQCLTDFGNGEAFKRSLKSNGYEGYVFFEEHDSPTYCIFESDKLSDPVHKY